MTVREGPLLSLTQMAALNQPSAPQKLPSHLKASASVQRASCFQGALPSCLQHLDPRSPCFANPDPNQALAHAHPQSASQGGLTLSRDQNHGFDTAFLQGYSTLPGGPCCIFTRETKDYRHLSNFLILFLQRMRCPLMTGGVATLDTTFDLVKPFLAHHILVEYGLDLGAWPHSVVFLVADKAMEKLFTLG